MLAALRQLLLRSRPAPISAEQRAALIELNLLELNQADARLRLQEHANDGQGFAGLRIFLEQAAACLESVRGAVTPDVEDWARWARVARRLNAGFDSEARLAATGSR